ncbi:MAG: hypothetical protein COY40_06575 [Alphaproteobacteria bacterium CG_4_10_14_0_8_um_filter_53_9]|nr:MAG: hypothetical protein COY40_06575 [Alphaproteobacteria bacterium CG_4_10_14_0_8_um_filter_53_9]
MVKLFLDTKLAPARLLVLIAVLRECLFVLPVFAAYYVHKGVTAQDVFLVQGWFRLCVFALEIPTGYLADSWHRHRQIQLASFLWALSMAMLWLASDLFGLLMVETLMALACALLSGTVSAYLYETLRAAGKVTQVNLWQSRKMALVRVAVMISALAGGWLFVVHPEAPVLAGLGTAVLAFLASLYLPDVPRTRRESMENPLRDMLRVTRWSLHKDTGLAALLVVPSLFFGLTSILFWVLPVRMETLGASAMVMGLAMAGSMGASALMAWYADALLQRVGLARVAALVWVCALGGAALTLLQDNLWLVWAGAVVSSSMSYTLAYPIIQTVLHDRLGDEVRATVLSVQSMFTTIFSGVMLVLVVPLAALVGLETLLSLYTVGVLAVILLFAPAFMKAATRPALVL